MAGEPDDVVAVVVLEPGSGRRITGDTRITAATVHDYAPDASDAEAVAEALASAGFEVGPLVGIAMSLAGPRSRFEDYFGTRVKDADDGGWLAVDQTGTATREVPLAAVPPPLARRVRAVTFEPPAELVAGEGEWP
jgi:hypothetical protein